VTEVQTGAPPLPDRVALWQTTGRPTLAVIAVIVCAAIPPFLVGALAPLIAHDVPFSATEVGVSIAAYYVVSGVLSPLGGRAVERIGVTRALRLSCIVTAGGLLTIALAHETLHFVMALAVLGIPNCVVQPAANAVLARVRTPRLQAVVFGSVQASIPAATLVAGVVLGVASYAGGWRWTVLSVASLTLVALWLTRGLPAEVRAPRPSSAGPTHVRIGPQGAWLLAMLVVVGFLASTAATSLPSYVASTGLRTDLAPGVVAAAQVLGSLACAATRIGAPLAVSHGTSTRRMVLIAVLLAAGAGGYALLSSGTAVGFFVGTVVAYAFGWGWNGLFNQVIVSVRPDRIASTTGMTQGGVFLGGALGPLAFAAAVHSHGYGAAWWISAGAAMTAVASAGVAIHLLRRGTGPNRND
jgi:predicted MFS family arabinose efflux permease